MFSDAEGVVLNDAMILAAIEKHDAKQVVALANKENINVTAIENRAI